MRSIVLAAGLAIVPVIGMGQVDAPLRDVLASAFLYPFLTDAEMLERTSDTEARIATDGGAVHFRYPGIAGVQADGRNLPGRRLGGDLWVGELPAGTHAVTLVVGEAGPPAVRVPQPGAVATAAEFRTRAEQLQPGDELVVADGIYSDWRVRVEAQGTAETPILIRPETPGGVTFRRNSFIRIEGQHIVLKGFRFDHCGPNVAVHLVNASDCRVTQCQFFSCGNPISTFGHILRVDSASHRNRVDHCYFTGSKSMSLAQRISVQTEVGTHNQFDRNIFRDIYRYWVNGQENIQIGQNQRGASGAAESFVTVEYNLFDHAWGDGEIFSNKSSRNRYRYNLASHCQRSSFTLRGGDHVLFEGNVMVNNGDGVRVMGGHHTIVNNFIADMPGFGLSFETGHEDGESNVASEGSLIAHNTIVDCLSGAVGAPPPGGARPHSPSRNIFRNNVFSGISGTLLDSRNMVGSVIERNLFHATEGALVGDAGTDAVLADPRFEGEGWHRVPAADSPVVNAGRPLPAVTHDRWQRRRPGGNAPDIGADEIAGQERPEGALRVPPVPARPLIAPQLYRGLIRYAQNSDQPAQGWRGAITEAENAFALGDGEAVLEQPLPGDFFLQWEYFPTAFASVASLTFSADEAGQGYTLEWGGAADDGKPTGVIRLRKSGQEEPVADAADVIQYYQNHRFQRWMGRTVDERTAPGSWYRFTLLKQDGRMILLLGRGRQGHDPGFPVLIWEDRDGPLDGPGLRIAQQGGGRWRNVVVADYEYTGDRAPEAPQGLTAEAAGGGRVALSWREEMSTAGRTYTIHRAGAPGFRPAPENLVATVTGRAEWHDLDVRPRESYAYQVFASNALGLRSAAAASTAVTTGTGGEAYHLLAASRAETVQMPMVLAPAPFLGRSYIWAPPGSPQSLAEAPAEGAAVFRFRVETPGTYAFWGLVQAPNEGSDSFHAGIGTPASFQAWHTGIHQAWGWSRIMAPTELVAGEQVLTIKPREAGTRLGAVLITSDTELVP